MSHILIVLALFALLALLFGLLLGYAAVRFRVDADPVVEKLDALLPRPSAGSAAIQAVAPTPRRLPMAMSSTNVFPAGNPPSSASPI